MSDSRIVQLRPEEPQTVGAPLRRANIQGVLPLASYGELFRTVLGPLGHVPGLVVNLALNIEVRPEDGTVLGERDPVVRRLREAARQLGLDVHVDVRPPR